MIPSTKSLMGIGALGGVALACLLMAAPGGKDHQSSISTNSAPAPDEAADQFPVTIRRPARPPQVATGLTNRHGEAITVSCGSCHTTTTPNRGIHSAEQLETFHQGLHYAHGAISCLSCHNENNYDTLRLADGTSIEYADVMTLCGQCHGPQLRDYRRGLHGGMTGYWDLSRGPRTRNNCVHCHDPHAPDFPLVQPVFPPRDRLPVPRATKDASH